MTSWFRSVVKTAPAMSGEEEDRHLQHVENALLQLLNDDIAAADEILKQHESSYHHLGRGISSFLASMLGAEKELLKDALNKLLLSESKNWEDMKVAQREPTAFRSKVYPPGTEYLLCYAVSQLTSAICGVMSGSVTEAVKGFYKLRKAYLTLDGILAAEEAYLNKQKGNISKSSHTATEKGNNVQTPHENGADGEKEAEARRLAANSDDDDFEVVEDNKFLRPTTAQSELLDLDTEAVGITSHTDIFIHAGTRLCYGMLLVIFSMIENPLFNKILYIVGFKGDRKRGTRYLWQAARFDSFTSAIAGMALLGYYNGLVGFCDILPTDAGADDDLSGYPKARCRKLLTDMRTRYPDSKLWKMEEARMKGYDRDLAGAHEILVVNSDSNMKQIAVINLFEMSFTSMFLHDYEESAKSWQRVAELSEWSPAMYAYLSGVAYLELYREYRVDDTEKEKAAKFKKLAEECIRKAPPLTGKQKVMSKELPFDTMIRRKIEKWEGRAKTWKVDLADATGVSPFVEMIYLWNGPRKQDVKLLEKSLALLNWERTSHPERFEGDVDEMGAKGLLESCVLRNLKKYEEARSILMKEIVSLDKSVHPHFHPPVFPQCF
ncbi:hypothetical protein HYFRA_00012388 [Hymenoscyphus fraxineus]|uniref:Inclusion body clearance protein IML2 n=1 Tax=Hymenoscyphus fraxineus TaxID=746836 RepID=A0A9N9L6F0_9HELO|nr:hypothetical protein HYFRA_00012388 [Hymenoscyphus fraxineus]